MRVVILILILFCNVAYGQIKVTKLSKAAIPKFVPYTGRLINAVSYADKEGSHLVLTTETGERQVGGVDDGSYREADLYAYQYNLTGTKYELKWKVHDFIKECPVDITANYVPGTFAVTDLNKDGKAEVWLMYRTVCKGDVSPSDMKIIMYEGVKKYAVRGVTKIKVSNTAYTGGTYAFDTAFKGAAKVYRDYATNLWKKNVYEN
jgi:hypothetical protein